MTENVCHNLGRTHPKSLAGDEPFHHGLDPTRITVRDFWRWSCSNLLSPVPNLMMDSITEFLEKMGGGDLQLTSAPAEVQPSTQQNAPIALTIC